MIDENWRIKNTFAPPHCLNESFSVNSLISGLMWGAWKWDDLPKEAQDAISEWENKKSKSAIVEIKEGSMLKWRSGFNPNHDELGRFSESPDGSPEAQQAINDWEDQKANRSAIKTDH